VVPKITAERQMTTTVIGAVGEKTDVRDLESQQFELSRQAYDAKIRNAAAAAAAALVAGGSYSSYGEEAIVPNMK